MTGIIDEERKVKHERLSVKLEEAITDPSKCQVKLKSDNVDIAFPPIIQSGGQYDLRVCLPIPQPCIKASYAYSASGSSLSGAAQ